MRKFKIAVCQNRPSSDKKKSVSHALKMIRRAASEGAELLVLPEIFYHPYVLKELPDLAESDKETFNILAAAAKELQIYICPGSMAEKENSVSYNRSYLISPEGKAILQHSKAHLFDVDMPGLRVKESAVFSPGFTFDVADTPLAKIGILICYDFRFPETARTLMEKGAELILIPAAFNNITGPVHWEPMLRCRAIENQLYIAAAAPALDLDSVYKSHGHSMIIDPWGTITAEARLGEKIIFAEFDPLRIKEVRSKLPLIKHRRPEIYGV